MKIVDLETFRKMPNGTVYSRYEPQIFTGLEVKLETWESDFIYQNLIGNVEADSSIKAMETLIEAEKGTPFKLEFDASQRDGLFDKDQLFAVYEPEDLEGLITVLKDCQKTTSQ